MNYQALKDEITNDPLTRSYSGMTDQQIADSLNNTVDRNVNRSAMSGSEIWEATNAADFNALSDTVQQKWLAFCGIQSVDPFGPAATFVTNVFGGGSNTVTALQAARTDTVSRATELGLGKVSETHVAMMRG